MHPWWFHWLGGDGGSIYDYVSGLIPDLAFLAGAYTLIRRHNCHVRGCHRVGLRVVPGTDHIVCHRHHPREQPTYSDVLRDHVGPNR